MSTVPVVDGARDFRLMTKKYKNAVLKLNERCRFTKGIFPWVGFDVKWFEYENIERTAGKTKWSFFCLFLYSLDGIIAFSTKPLVFSAILGIFNIFLSFLLISFIVARKLIFGDAVQGWASLVCIVLFLSGIQLFTYFLNAVFPTQSDDLGRKIGGLTAAINQYQTWNGRLGELLLGAFGSYFATTLWYAPINALVGTAVLLLIFTVTFARLPKASTQDCAVCAVLVLFVLFDPVFCFGSVFYWAAGSFNYLWAWLLILLWALPYRLYWQSIISGVSQSLHPVLAWVGIPLIGFFAGWSSEFGIVFIVVQLCLIGFRTFVQKKSIPLWYCAGLATFTAGWLVLYLCPGMRLRVAYFEEYRSISDILHLPFSLLLNRIFAIYAGGERASCIFYEHYFLLSLFLVVSAVFNRLLVKKYIKLYCHFFIIVALGLLLKYTPHIIFLLTAIIFCIAYAKWLQKTHKKESQTFFIIAGILFAECLFMCVTIQISVPARANFQITLLNFILIAVVMVYCFDIFSGNKTITRIACGCCIVASVGYSTFVGYECYVMHKKWDVMLTDIQRQKQQGLDHIVVDKRTFVSRYWNYGDWGVPNEKTDEWPNTSFAVFFDVKTFCAQ